MTFQWWLLYIIPAGLPSSSEKDRYIRIVSYIFEVALTLFGKFLWWHLTFSTLLFQNLLYLHMNRLNFIFWLLDFGGGSLIFGNLYTLLRTDSGKGSIAKKHLVKITGR